MYRMCVRVCMKYRSTKFFKPVTHRYPFDFLSFHTLGDHFHKNLKTALFFLLFSFNKFATYIPSHDTQKLSRKPSIIQVCMYLFLGVPVHMHALTPRAHTHVCKSNWKTMLKQRNVPTYGPQNPVVKEGNSVLNI